MDKDLLLYVKNQLDIGTDRAVIARTLQEQGGWSEDDIAAVFAELQASAPPLVKESYVSPHTSNSKTMSKLLVALTIIFLIIALLLGGAGYLYLNQLGPFAERAPYDESNLASGLLASFANIKTAKYNVAGKLEMTDRDQDARPFVLPPSTDIEKLQQQYTNDSNRLNDVSTMLNHVNYYSISSPLPKTISEFESVVFDPASPFYRYDVDQRFIDPESRTPYQYTLSEDGQSFTLIVTFETHAAVKAVRTSNPQTAINDKTVTFTKESASWFNFSPTPPKPYFETFNEMADFLPPELLFEASLAAATDFSGENPNWTTALDMAGDFGDLTYKIGGDLERHEENYYLRVRHIPGPFAGALSQYKNTWIRVTPSFLESQNTNQTLPINVSGLPEAEETYKENRAKIASYLKRVLEIADEQKIILLEKPPQLVKQNDERLYRYDLTVNKANFLTFVQQTTAEAEKSNISSDFPFLNDTGLLEYLQTDEFDAVFDYFINNLTFSVFVTTDGTVNEIGYTFRMVPPDSAEALQKKQLLLSLQLTLDDVNEPLSISAPDTFRDATEIMAELQPPQEPALDTSTEEISSTTTPPQEDL